jgi:hypothetical protein
VSATTSKRLCTCGHQESAHRYDYQADMPGTCRHRCGCEVFVEAPCDCGDCIGCEIREARERARARRAA